MKDLRKTNDAPASVLAGLSLSVLLSSFGTSSANVALPTLAQAYDTSFQEVQWVVLAYLLTMTALIVSMGRMGDIFGRRRLLLAGLVVFTIASVIGALAPTFWVLVAARGAQGVGAAAMMALSMALVGDTIPKTKSGSAMGLLGTMSAIGTALGPSLGGLLMAWLGWRAIFLVNLPLGLVALLLARRALVVHARTTQPSTVPLDIAGMVLLAVTLTAYSLAMTLGHGFGALNAALLLAASSGLVWFLRTEARVVSPLIRLATFRSPGISAGFGMSALVATVVMATLVVGPFYLSGALGLTTPVVGAVMALGPLVAAATGVPAGRLVDRLGPGAMTLAGLAAMMIASVALAFSPAAFGVAGYVAPLVVLTAGYALFQAANNTMVMTGIPQNQRGEVAGVLNLSRNIGLITGASVMGSIFALASGASGAVDATAQGIASGTQFTFAVGAVFVMSALAIAARSKRLTASLC